MSEALDAFIDMESHKGASRSKICALQDALLEFPEQSGQNDEFITHYFAPNVYGRQIDMPAGLVVVGKIHKHAHLNIITKGTVKVTTEKGSEVYTAPKTWISEPGIKRAVLVLEDTQWLTIHPNETDTKDLNELEDFVIAPDFQALDAFLSGKLENKT